MPPGADEQTSSTLLERARQQDPLAWDRLVQLYMPLVWRWCRRMNVRPDDAEDICQDVMRAVFGSLPTFRRDRPGDTFRGWLRTITRNKVRDQWPKWSRIAAEGGSNAWLDGVVDPDADVTTEADDTQELGILFRWAVKVIRAECNDRTWTAFWRVEIEDEPVDAVAAALQMSRNAVYLALSRTRKRLRTLLIELGEEPPANA